MKHKLFSMVNLLITLYIQLYLVFEIFIKRTEYGAFSGIMIFLSSILIVFYYKGYWFGEYPKLKREWVLLFGLVYAVFMFKLGFESAIFMAAIMISSGFYTNSGFKFVAFEFLTMLILLVLPIQKTLDLRTHFSMILTIGFYVLSFWFFTYYQRANLHLMEMQRIKEESARVIERQKIAKQLHDELGHSLTALNFHLEYGQSLSAEDFEQSRLLMQQMKAITTEAIESCKKVVYTLNEGQENETFVFSVALDQWRKQIEPFQIYTDISVPMDTWPGYLQKMILRTVKEAVTNTMKHAQTSALHFEVTSKDDLIKVFMYDGGKGAGNFALGNGLSGIKDRVEALEGQVQYYDTEANGFCIDICLPKEILR